MSRNIKLTVLERYNISNQLRILEALYPDDAQTYSTQREVFERGYEMMYGWYFEHIYEEDDVMTIEESTEVFDTLEMFDAINRCLVKNKDSELADNPFTKFMGYDGNNETKFMTFARFTIEDLGRFEYIPLVKDNYFNSHMPARGKYLGMMHEWKKIDENNRMNLSLEQVSIIISAERLQCVI